MITTLELAYGNMKHKSNSITAFMQQQFKSTTKVSHSISNRAIPLVTDGQSELITNIA